MDFDLHFGRFFGPKIDVFEKFLLPDFELQLEVRSAKIVILPWEHTVFYKIDILALKWQSMKNIKKNRKNITSKSSCFFTLIFLGFWSQLGWILASKLRPVPACPLDTFSKLRPRGVQEAPKRLQERPKGVSRASNSLPRGPQECPRATKTCPGRAQGASRGILV